jgi:hypothetical protein
MGLAPNPYTTYPRVLVLAALSVDQILNRVNCRSLVTYGVPKWLMELKSSDVSSTAAIRPVILQGSANLVWL